MPPREPRLPPGGAAGGADRGATDGGGEKLGAGFGAAGGGEKLGAGFGAAGGGEKLGAGFGAGGIDADGGGSKDRGEPDPMIALRPVDGCGTTGAEFGADATGARFGCG